MVNSEEEIVTLIPRFVITQGEPPVRECQPEGPMSAQVEVTDTIRPEDAEDLWAPSPSDVSVTLMPADIDDYQTTHPLPARSMLRRLPSLLD